MPNFEELLKAALAERTKREPQSLVDLNGVTAELHRAVESATRGRMRMFLRPIRTGTGVRNGTALVTRFTNTDEERILMVFEVSEHAGGYPMQAWFTTEAWKRNQLDGFVVIGDSSGLRGLVQKLISSPDSALVRLIANELAVAEADGQAALAP